ncbi:hypothetical protein B484DRAFT_347856, partial [Ochromonadaceae sp. CCMP2298]
MFTLALQLALLATATAFAPSLPSFSRHALTSSGHNTRTYLVSNSDMFSSPKKEAGAETVTATAVVEAGTAVVDVVETKQAARYGDLKDQAAKLRREAADMEVALREEARAKGLPEEMINKLIPISKAPKTALDRKAEREEKEAAAVAVTSEAVASGMTANEVRAKLGYLNTGDAVRFTTELNRIKAKGVLSQWNSFDLSAQTGISETETSETGTSAIVAGNVGKTSFIVSNYQLKAKTNINPVDLKLDDVGFNYQAVFFVALGGASVLALSASFVGGQLGFILGYLSALFPVTLVGVGSVAPALLGDIVNGYKLATNAELKAKYVRCNAGKFLVGYVLGLPVSRFSTAGASNTVEFFQIRPSGKQMSSDEKQMFARNKFSQGDIAPSSAVSIAGNVAQCMKYTVAQGTNANDVNTLYELISTVDPPLSPERVQDHIRWSACTAFDILKSRSGQLEALCGAFESNLPLEECIAIIEGRESAMGMGTG